MTRKEMIKNLRYKASNIKTRLEPSFFMDVADELEQEPCEDAISREQAVDAVADLFEMSEYPHPYPQGKPIRLKDIKEKLKQLPPVTSQPKTGHWIPVKFRPLTDKEQEEYPDYCYMADCPMPDDGEEILVSTKSGRVEKDESGFDDGYYLDSGHDWQTDIVAWMPLPEPYEPQESEET